MRKVLIIILLGILIHLYGTEKEDVVFIQSLFKNSHYDFALREIDLFLNKYPQSPQKNDVTILKANVLMQKGQIIESQEILTNILKNNPAPTVFSQVLLSLAENYRLQKDYPSALSFINDFFLKFPKHPELQRAYFIAGLIDKDRQNYEKALKNLNEASQLGFNPEIEYNRIELYLLLNQKSFADSVLNQFNHQEVSQKEKNYAFLMILKNLEQNSNWDEIIKSIPDSFSVQDLYSEEIVYVKINAYSEKNDFQNAMKLLDSIQENSDKRKFFKGKLLLKMHQPDEGLPLLKQLAETSKNTEIKTISYFHYISFLAQTNPDSAIVLLSDYLANNPNQKWEGDIYYQLGFNYFRLKNYHDSYLNLDKAIKFGLDETILEKALYLKGETQFLLAQKQNALDIFKSFINQFPQSALLDEALFKIGISYYNLAYRDSAVTLFNEIITDFPNSSKKGMCYFYLAENELNQKKLNNAKKLYENALIGNCDRGTINLRLAYIEYLRKSFQTAKEFLNNVSDDNDYIFDKNLLKGNIFFAEKNYQEALKAYNTAEVKSPDQLSLEHVWSRQAWTFYKLKQYDQATRIYKQLSAQSSAPGKYILSAAGAAFNAENYIQAVDLYTEYITTYPESKEFYKAQGGLANAHFNLANYQEAIKEWEKLVNPIYPKTIIENALQGIQWSYQYQNKQNDFLKWIDGAISQTNDNDLKNSLFDVKIKFEYDQKEYVKSINTIKNYIKQFPSKKDDDKLQIMLANNYIWLKQFEKADSIYITLVIKRKDPEVYHEWGHIKWAIADTVGALKRFKRAADNSKLDDYWLVLLDKQQQAKDPEFDLYYKKYSAFANSYHLEMAKLILIEKYISLAQYDEALTLAINLDASENPYVRAKAIHDKAVIYYLQNNYIDAQKEFLRVRYVFTEYEDLRINSEFYLCLIYINQNEKEKALEIYHLIKDKISANERDIISNKLKGREE